MSRFHVDTAEQLRDVFCILTVDSAQQPYVKSKEYKRFLSSYIIVSPAE